MMINDNACTDITKMVNTGASQISSSRSILTSLSSYPAVFDKSVSLRNLLCTLDDCSDDGDNMDNEHVEWESVPWFKCNSSLYRHRLLIKNTQNIYKPVETTTPRAWVRRRRLSSAEVWVRAIQRTTGAWIMWILVNLGCRGCRYDEIVFQALTTKQIWSLELMVFYDLNL